MKSYIKSICVLGVLLLAACSPQSRVEIEGGSSKAQVIKRTYTYKANIPQATTPTPEPIKFNVGNKTAPLITQESSK